MKMSFCRRRHSLKTSRSLCRTWQTFRHCYTVLPDGNLLLGPFQGKPACIRIKAGRGVCGTALAEKKTLRVADVHAFPGHIACDSASRAEIVVPVMKDGKVYAVLDVDSPFENRFTAGDEAFLEKIAALLAEKF